MSFKEMSHATRKFNAQQDLKVRLLAEDVVELARAVMLEKGDIDAYSKRELVVRLHDLIERTVGRMK